MEWTNRIPRLLELISKHAPNFPVSIALELSNRIERAEFAEHELAKVIGILSESKLGITDNGALPNLDSESEAVKWAMKKAQYIHAGWSCGPGGGIKELMKDFK